MENKVLNFEDLKIWQEGIVLAIKIYSLFNYTKDYGMKDQVQRAAVSIPSNIAEGFDRQSNNEFIRFLRISKGSCAELRTQLIIAKRIGLIEKEDNTVNQTIKLSMMIQKMISYREKFKKQ